MVTEEDLWQRLLDAVLADPVCSAVLDRTPALGLPEWWLTAGAVFQNVWNSVEGRAPGNGIKDYDLFYFDDSDLSWAAEDRVIQRAASLFAALDATVEVRNQARVHLWYADRFGVAAPPFTSARDAIDAFASTTCCVGITLGADGIQAHAPYGLADVFAMHLRPHRRLAPREVYETKAEEYQQRWPSVTADPWT